MAGSSSSHRPGAPGPYADPPDAWRGLLDLVVCPLCGGRLAPADHSLRCPERHTFDIARQGYVSLLTGNMRAANADSAAMVEARVSFLAAGHYAPPARALAAVCTQVCPPRATVLDAGTGTGYYLAAVLDALPGAVGVGLDLSTFALRRAARAHPRAAAAAWDVWRPLPVRSGSVDAVLNVFAPRNGPEFHRVLRPGGALVVATPTPRHLAELRQPLGLLSVDAAKEERLHDTLSAHFHRESAEEREHTVTLTGEEVSGLVSMGPSARHLDPDALRRAVARLDTPVPVTASFLISVYRPR